MATFYVPLVIILLLYWRIFVTARNRLRNRQAAKAHVPTSVKKPVAVAGEEANSSGHSLPEDHKGENANKKEGDQKKKVVETETKIVGARNRVTTVLIKNGGLNNKDSAASSVNGSALEVAHSNSTSPSSLDNEDDNRRALLCQETAFSVAANRHRELLTPKRQLSEPTGAVCRSAADDEPERRVVKVNGNGVLLNNNVRGRHSPLCPKGSGSSNSTYQNAGCQTESPVTTATATDGGGKHRRSSSEKVTHSSLRTSRFFKDRGTSSRFRGTRGSSLGRSRKEKKHVSLEAKRERKAAKTLAIVTGAFIACWLPFFILALIMPIFPERNFEPHLVSFFLWLGYFNSTLNPIIYTVFSPEFRQAFQRILFGKVTNQNHRPRHLQ